MKPKVFIAIAVSMLAVNCRKANNSISVENLTGTWKSIGYGGGFAGIGFTPEPDSINNYLQFDTTRILFNTNGSQNCTAYTFIKDSAANFSGLLTFNDTTTLPHQYDVKLNNDTLALYPHGVADEFTTYYARNLQRFSWCPRPVH